MAYRIVLLPLTFTDRQGYFGYGRSKNKGIYKSDLHAVLGLFVFMFFVARNMSPIERSRCKLFVDDTALSISFTAFA